MVTAASTSHATLSASSTRSTNPSAYGARFANTGIRHTKNASRHSAQRMERVTSMTSVQPLMRKAAQSSREQPGCRREREKGNHGDDTVDHSGDPRRFVPVARRIRWKEAADDGSDGPYDQQPQSRSGSFWREAVPQSECETQRRDSEEDETGAEGPAEPARHVVADRHVDGAQLGLDGVHAGRRMRRRGRCLSRSLG